VSNKQVGIRYSGSAGGVARQNECSGNGWHGISVSDQAQPTLENNKCGDNSKAGIGYWENAGGVARGNECWKNKWGIYVKATARPELVDNYCHDNEVDVLDERLEGGRG
jgi:parallel beta-helix repeat protein